MLRVVAERAGDRVAEAKPVQAVRAAMKEIRDRRARVPEAFLRRAALRARNVEAATVNAREGGVDLLIELDGSAVRATLVPESARFAARGAKEIAFRVEPADAAHSPAVREVAGLFASLVARALWGPVLGAPPGGIDEPAIVDREGDRLVVDLRNCPAVRAAKQRSAAAELMMDAVSVDRFEADVQGLSLRFAMPPIAG